MYFKPLSTYPVIVIGMHRSGTELVSILLKRLGVFIGADLDVHAESEYFKDINRNLLWAEGASWNKPSRYLSRLINNDFITQEADKVAGILKDSFDNYGAVPQEGIWGWKDPRNTITLPVWLRLFPESKIIHVVRHGFNVALSLQRREMRRLPRVLARASRERMLFPPTLINAFRLWEVYVETAGKWEEMHSCPWFQVYYEDIVESPQAIMASLQTFLDISGSVNEIYSATSLIRSPRFISQIDRLRLFLLGRSGEINVNLLNHLGYSVLPQ